MKTEIITLNKKWYIKVVGIDREIKDYRLYRLPFKWEYEDKIVYTSFNVATFIMQASGAIKISSKLRKRLYEIDNIIEE